jgi:Fe-S cluster assembly scaffold protein SufB
LAGVAVDAVFDSVSVATTYKEALKEQGVIFCSISAVLFPLTTPISVKYCITCSVFLLLI